MSWIKVVEDESASGTLKEVYDKIKRARGKLSNIMRVHSLRPEVMDAHMDLYLKIMFGRIKLSRKQRELIATVVSAVNKCKYCLTHHGDALNHYWKDDAKVKTLVNDFRSVDLDDKDRAMLEYAFKLTKAPQNIAEDDLEALRKHGFSDEDILDINLIASYFNFVNRVAAGLGVRFSDEELKGYKY